MVMNANFEVHSKAGVKTVAALQRPPASAAFLQLNGAIGTESAMGAGSAPRGQRRNITREQGRALETIGHAVDYLNDRYLYDGAEAEILNVAGPFTDALQMLIAARQEILRSLPVLPDPWSLRVWNALFRRKPRLASGPVVT